MAKLKHTRSIVDRAFPGLKCKWLELTANTSCGYFLQYTLEGDIETLVTHRLATREQLESLPPCGVRGYCRRVREGVYQVRRYFSDYRSANAQDEIRRLGLPLPAMPATCCELRIGRKTSGNVIYVDWAARQQQVVTARAIAAVAAATESGVSS